jgi:hypothetical protein
VWHCCLAPLGTLNCRTGNDCQTGIFLVSRNSSAKTGSSRSLQPLWTRFRNGGDEAEKNADLPIARIFLEALELNNPSPEKFRIALESAAQAEMPTLKRFSTAFNTIVALSPSNSHNQSVEKVVTLTSLSADITFCLDGTKLVAMPGSRLLSSNKNNDSFD